MNLTPGRHELAPGLEIEVTEVKRLAWSRALRLRLVFAFARLLRVPIRISDDFYDPTPERRTSDQL